MMKHSHQNFFMIRLLPTTWLILLVLLTAWWGWQIWTQAARIAALEQDFDYLFKMKRMLLGESGFLALLLCASSFFFVSLYRREQERLQTAQRFFSSMTHELKTPLASIRLCSEAILEGGEKATEKQWLSRLIQDTLRLELQIEKMLEWARLEASFHSQNKLLPLQPRSLSALLKHFLHHTPPLSFQSSGHNVHPLSSEWLLNNHGAEAWVQVHEGVLLFILKNIVENAIRHSGRKPVTVTLHTEFLKNQVVWIFENQGASCSLALKDLGKPFHKGQASCGTGLGLYLIRCGMRRMGGEALFIPKPEGFEVRLVFQVTLEEKKSHVLATLRG